ncbi:MAG TPA: GNAT family N-acetyltransferase [Candidatus Binataceae bacterium]|nr:GNAT family N-acetyltransferase [Candidatus Binataceae bacterium]
MDSTTQRPTAAVLFPEQYGEAARALGRAFINDPPIRVLLPEPADPVERARLLTYFFEAMLGIQRNTGEPVIGVVIDNKVVAAAILESGGVPVASLVLHGLLQMPRMVKGIGWDGLWRGIQLQGELLKNHPHEPHIYLNFLGVDPDYQRHHCGSAIIEELRRLASMRSKLAGVYLETGTEENVAYYSARGYETLGEIHPLGCRMWRMLQRRA